MPYITEAALATFQEQGSVILSLRSQAFQLESTVEKVSPMIVAAARQGFVNEYQKQALYFALEELTGESYLVLNLILDVKIKGRKGV